MAIFHVNLGKVVPAQFSSSTFINRTFGDQWQKLFYWKQSIEPNQWPGLISSSTTGLLMKGALLSLRQLAKASIHPAETLVPKPPKTTFRSHFIFQCNQGHLSLATDGATQP